MTTPKISSNATKMCSANTIHQIWMEGELHLRQKKPNEYAKMLKMRKIHHNEHRLWDSSMIEALIKSEYPKLMDTYNKYPYQIMRLHLAKYIILHRFGGFYVDIDCKPKKSLYELIQSQDLHRRSLPTVIADHDDYNKCVKSTKKFINTFFIYIPYSKHPLMNIILSEAPKVAKRKLMEPHLKWVMRCSGAYLFTRCIKMYKKWTQKELKKAEHQPMIHDLVSKHNECVLEKGGSISTRSYSKLSGLTFSDLSMSLSRSELSKTIGIKSAVHTQDVVNLTSAELMDFYFHRCENPYLWLNNEHDLWMKELKRHNRAKLGGGQAAVLAVCVGVLIVAL